MRSFLSYLLMNDYSVVVKIFLMYDEYLGKPDTSHFLSQGIEIMYQGKARYFRCLKQIMKHVSVAADSKSSSGL